VQLVLLLGAYMKLTVITPFIHPLWVFIRTLGSFIPAVGGVFSGHDSKTTKFFTQSSAACSKMLSLAGEKGCALVLMRCCLLFFVCCWFVARGMFVGS